MENEQVNYVLVSKFSTFDPFADLYKKCSFFRNLLVVLKTCESDRIKKNGSLNFQAFGFKVCGN